MQFFNNRGNTVTLGFVDIRKAFDKCNQWGILQCLQNKFINPVIIDILDHWFQISTAKIKWNNVLSNPVTLTAGVRQGGVLSPLLFSAYVDTVLIELGKTNSGCFINKLCLNSFMYADDLILLSISVTDLQDLLSKCASIF